MKDSGSGRQGEPPKEPKRPTLKILEQKGSLTIQTEELAIQAIFSSAVLEAANYIEQLEKYCLRAALSAINLKVEEYDAYYTRAKERIEEVYNTLTYRSMGMIQDLLLSLRLAKIEMWREQTAVANGLRTHLYQKALDPYGFRAGQFDADVGGICEARGTLKEGAIEELSQRLRECESVNMEGMFSGRVVQPYLAQNKDHNEVDPSAMYASLLGQIRLKMEKSDEALLKRHACIQEEIVKFMQFATEHNMRTQRVAHTLIKRYNECSENGEYLLRSVCPVVELVEKKETFNADDLFTGRQYRSELKPAFANRNHNVEFRPTCKLFDPESGSVVEVEQRQPEESHREWDRYGCIEAPAPRVSPFDSFSERKRNNPKEFYQLREFQKQKYREEELRLREKDRGERDREKERERAGKRIIRILPTPPPWSDLTDHDFPFLYFYAQRRLKEAAFWESRQREAEAEEQVYAVRRQRAPQSPMFRSAEERGKHELELRREAEAQAVQSEQAALSYEMRRREEESVRLTRIQRLIEGRSYQAFMSLSKWQSKTPPFCDSNTVSRYGITFNLNWEQSSRDLREVDTFFYRYFKERYFREKEEVRENGDNPIILLDSSKYHMGSTNKLVSQYVASIVKKVETLPFFVVWADELLVYRGREGRGACEFYPYGEVANAQKLMYELRRRARVAVREEIREQFGKASEAERIYSKVEVTHRAIFDRHRPMPDLARSVSKGREIVREIIESLRNGKM